MTTWVLLTLIGMGGLGSIAALLYFLGRNHSHDALVELESAAKQAELKALSERRTAQIFTLPKGTWSETIDKL